jgi:hypothetical protein
LAGKLISILAWIFTEFVFYGLSSGSAPDFGRVKKYKYVGSLTLHDVSSWLARKLLELAQVSQKRSV